MPLKTAELNHFLDSYLNSEEFKDYGPNGLQISGRPTIKRIAFAVSATLESIETSISQKACALIVHHGLFWSFHGPKAIVGPHGERIKKIIQHDMNLFGYHLPLDAHITSGNAAGMAKKMGLKKLLPFGSYKGSPVGVKGTFQKPVTIHHLQKNLAKVLQHEVYTNDYSATKKIKTVGIITGGASSYWSTALEDKVDAFISGEMKEHDWHDSREAGIHMLAGGHNHTERFGVQELKKVIDTKFKKYNIKTFFIPSHNPM